MSGGLDVAMRDAFQDFVASRRCVTGVSAATVAWYHQSWRAFSPRLPGRLSELSQRDLERAVGELRAGGLSAVSVNTYSRSINAFLSWAFSQGRLEDRLHIPRMIEGRRIPKTLAPESLARLLAYRGRTFAQRRLAASVALMLDTGIRIAELVALDRADINLEDSLVSVLIGKGGRGRIVPISRECRRRLFAFLRLHGAVPAFPTIEGRRLVVGSVQMQIRRLGDQLGIAPLSPHRLRHTFATRYVARGGDPFRLQKILGHSTLQMARRYCELSVADLRAVHDELSPLSGEMTGRLGRSRDGRRPPELPVGPRRP